MNTKVWLLALAGLAAIVGCQQEPPFTKLHPQAVLLTQGVYPPPAVEAGACQKVYVYDDISKSVVLQTATTQPTKIDLKDAAAFGGTRMLWNVNLSHHYSIYSESNLPPVKPASVVSPSPVTVAPAKPAATTMPAPALIKPTSKPVDPQIQASKVYDRGVEEWNAQKWEAARADFICAEALGYRTGFGQRSPEEFVKRIDKKIADANAAKQKSGISKPATQSSTRPAK